MTESSAPPKLTEEFLLNTTGCKKLSEIKKLSLHDISLEELDPRMLQRMVNLEELDVSKNKIEEVPQYLRMPKLRKFDISSNLLTSVEFVEQFPNLEELSTEENEALDTSDKYIAAYLCPSLQYINKTRESSFQQVVDTYRRNLMPQIEEVWEENYSEKYNDDHQIPERLFMNVHKQFVEKIKENEKLFGHSNLQKFQNFMVNQLAKELMVSVQSHTYESPAKRRRLEESEESSSEEEEVKAPVAKKPKNTSSSSPKSTPKNTPKSTPRKALPEKVVHEFTQLKDKLDLKKLPAVPDYDPMHFLRCHSRDNDPSDNQTKVWRCAFEPDLKNPDRTTNLVATCGGDCICIIDCSTGKLMMRYKHPKEHFFTLAWTVLTREDGIKNSRRISVLAVAGKQGVVRLIHPAQQLCYVDLKPGHTKYISSLLFHPDEPQWLFSGSNDSKIILWDIGVPTLPDYKTDFKQLIVLRSPGGDVLNLAFVKDPGYLIGGCENGCFAWNIDTTSIKKKVREPSFEICLPGSEGDIVDALVQVSDDLIATKCTEQGCIQLWKFSEVLTQGKKSKLVNVQPLTLLEWQDTDIPYVNLGSLFNTGIMFCGDDEGDLWMYNVKRFMQDKITDIEKMYAPSRILKWPICCIDSEAKRQTKMMGDVLDNETLILNSASSNWNGEFIVAGTDNNLVCIWQKCK